MNILYRLLLGGITIGLVASCSSTPQSTGSDQTRHIKPVSCIAVLPARAGEPETVSRTGGKMDNVKRGAAYADLLVRNELTGEPKVRFVQSSDNGNLPAIIADVSEKTGCEGVMVTTVYKFRQREGSGMAVDAPASTAFDMRIYEGQSRQVLWAADFSDTQKSLLSDIFSFDKAMSRGFKWVTVEELMEEGIKERLTNFPYLSRQ